MAAQNDNYAVIKPEKPKHMFKIKIIIIIALTFNIVPTHAQSGVVSAGGEAAGAGGSMSHSSGLPDFMFFSSAAGSIQFGIQQTFFFDDDNGDPEVPEVRQLNSADILQGEDQCFDATQTIVLAGNGQTFIVEAGTGVTLLAGYNILMLPGTKVENGGYLHARIVTDGIYCTERYRTVVAVHEYQDYENDKESFPENYNYQETNSDELNFIVFPNPTRGNFTLGISAIGHDEGMPLTIEIIGMRGELISRQTMEASPEIPMNLAGQQSGLYLIRIRYGYTISTIRVMKR
ncbi:MAG: T9SS C-terminal target domain-containing protein [Bacteroidia bacterium]|nr:MAG: T9SS C-terminal target domain-containing protein [Bacteroidia bacterium]